VFRHGVAYTAKRAAPALGKKHPRDAQRYFEELPADLENESQVKLDAALMRGGSTGESRDEKKRKCEKQQKSQAKKP